MDMPAGSAAAPAAALDERVAAQLERRVAALERLFEHVGATRMQALPMVHPGLAVKALGFELQGDGPGGSGGAGVLVTPWCMNLVWLPLEPVRPGGANSAPREAALPPGATRTRAMGCERFDFIGAIDPGFGAYETCSLFSPMFEFADQAAALATAQQVLAILRAPQPAGDPAPARPSRRALLFGPGPAARPTGGR